MLFRLTKLTSSLGLLTLAVLATLSSGQGGGAEAAVPGSAEFVCRAVRDVAYYSGPDAHPQKHQLDLYVPVGCPDFPVVVFVHGGAWRHGDKRMLFDVHGKLAQRFAKNGVGMAVINYRLSPQVKHPEHAKDVARAVGWVAKHINEFGGQPRNLFLSGHSAGGHLVALLATDPRYLAAEGLSLADIRGVVAISGVYEIPPQQSFFPSVFGTDPEIRRSAAPLTHVKPNLPPFLLLYGEHDYLGMDQMAKRFAASLRQAGNEVHVEEIKGRDHLGIVGRMLAADDPALQLMLKFIAGHSQP